MMKNTARFAQVEVLKKNSPAAEWTTNPESLRHFWKWGGNWRGIQSRAKHQSDIDRERRIAVAEVLKDQYQRAGQIIPSAMTDFENGSHVITTGHQLQVGGGPGYFHYKILSAIRWAQRMKAEGHDAVAVFWLASEDHDFDEIKTTHGPHGSRLDWTPEGVEKKGPVGELVWDDEAEKAWSAWAMENGVKTVGVEGLSLTLADRMRAWISEWFGNLDLLIVDGNDPELKSMALHLWEAEWDGSGIGQDVKSVVEPFENTFGQAQIQPRANNLFVLNDDGSRQRADRWQEKHGKGNWRDLRPEQHSPNVALRPLYQEFLLQSTAFVGGPSEVSYWMLLDKAFAHHGIQPPALLVRDGALILNTKTTQLSKELNWNPTLPEMRGEEAVNAWADQKISAQGDLQVHFDRWGEALENHAKGIHTSTLPATRAALAKMEKEFSAVKKKWRKIVKQQHHEKCVAIFDELEGWISPNGLPQERFINALALTSTAGNWSDFTKGWLEAVKGTDDPQFLIFE